MNKHQTHFVRLCLTLALMLGPVFLLPQAARAAEITVCLEGPCDYNTIQAAVDAAESGDTIKVAMGTYMDIHAHASPAGYIGPDQVEQVVYIDKSLTLQGGYTVDNFAGTPDPAANPTILNAQGQGRVLFVTGGAQPTIAGLRLTGGDAAGLVGCTPWEDDAGGGLYSFGAKPTLHELRVYGNAAAYGSGLYLENSPATLTDSQIENNTATQQGGGIYVWDSDATINQNTFSNNAADFGGGLRLVNSDVEINDNYIIDNTASSEGGGVYLGVSTATLLRNTITGNAATGDGGGIYLRRNNAGTLLSDNWIANNSAARGGGVVSAFYDGSTLVNTFVTDNSVTTGAGGLYIDFAAIPTLIHVTLAGNTGGDGSGVQVNDSTAYFTNTILISHTVGIVTSGTGRASLESTLWGNGTDTSGSGIETSNNVYGNPAFANPGNGNYRISFSSVARDAGVEAGVDHDIEGEPRPMDQAPDLGADEFPGIGLAIVKTPSNQALDPGQRITYTIAVTSAGTQDAVGVIFTDTLDSAQRPLSLDDGGLCTMLDNGWGGSFACSAGTLAPGEGVLVTLIAELTPDIASGLTVKNTVVGTAEGTTNRAVAINRIGGDNFIFLPVVIRSY